MKRFGEAGELRDHRGEKSEDFKRAGESGELRGEKSGDFKRDGESGELRGEKSGNFGEAGEPGACTERRQSKGGDSEVSYIGGSLFQTLGELDISADRETPDTQTSAEKVRRPSQNIGSEADTYISSGKVPQKRGVDSAGTTGSGKRGARRFQKRNSGTFRSSDKGEKSPSFDDVSGRDGEHDRPRSAGERSSAQRKGSVSKFRVGSGKSSAKFKSRMARGSVQKLFKSNFQKETSRLIKSSVQKEATAGDEDTNDDTNNIQDPTVLVKRVLALVNSSEDGPSATDSAFLNKVQDELQVIYKSLSILPKKPESVNDEGQSGNTTDNVILPNIVLPISFPFRPEWAQETIHDHQFTLRSSTWAP